MYSTPATQLCLLGSLPSKVIIWSKVWMAWNRNCATSYISVLPLPLFLHSKEWMTPKCVKFSDFKQSNKAKNEDGNPTCVLPSYPPPPKSSQAMQGKCSSFLSLKNKNIGRAFVPVSVRWKYCWPRWVLLTSPRPCFHQQVKSRLQKFFLTAAVSWPWKSATTYNVAMWKYKG